MSQLASWRGGRTPLWTTAALLVIAALVSCRDGDDRTTREVRDGARSTPEALQGLSYQDGATVVSTGDDGSAVVLAVHDRHDVGSEIIRSDRLESDDLSWSAVDASRLRLPGRKPSTEPHTVVGLGAPLRGASTRSAAWVSVLECRVDGYIDVDYSCSAGAATLTIGRLGEGETSWAPVLDSTDSPIGAEGTLLHDEEAAVVSLYGTTDRLIVVVSAEYGRKNEVWSLDDVGAATRVGPADLPGPINGVCALGDSLYLVDSLDAVRRLPGALDGSTELSTLEPEPVPIDVADVAGGAIPDGPGVQADVLCNDGRIMIRSGDEMVAVDADGKGAAVELPVPKVPIEEFPMSAAGSEGDSVGAVIGYDAARRRSEVVLWPTPKPTTFETAGYVSDVQAAVLGDGSVLVVQQVSDEPRYRAVDPPSHFTIELIRP